jgi:hypothetical protein
MAPSPDKAEGVRESDKGEYPIEVIIMTAEPH